MHARFAIKEAEVRIPNFCCWKEGRERGGEQSPRRKIAAVFEGTHKSIGQREFQTQSNQMVSNG